MLTFKSSTLALGLLLLAWGLAAGLGYLPAWTLAIPVIAWVCLMVYGSIRIQSGFYLRTICSGDPSQKKIALSFDDGPLDLHTPRILDILHQHDVPAAFFCIGHRLSGHPLIARRIIAEGHLIGNHSYSHHFWFDLFSARRIQDDLRQMDQACVSATGQRPAFFRPPYGVTNPNIRKAVSAGGYQAIGWSLRSLDTTARSGDQLLEKLMRGIHPGAIILLHDAGPHTAGILGRFIVQARSSGFEFVRLDHLINQNAYA